MMAEGGSQRTFGDVDALYERICQVGEGTYGYAFGRAEAAPGANMERRCV